MEPMAGATAENREREERQKFRDGTRGKEMMIRRMGKVKQRMRLVL
jgi:hypothetical protein